MRDTKLQRIQDQVNHALSWLIKPQCTFIIDEANAEFYKYHLDVSGVWKADGIIRKVQFDSQWQSFIKNEVQKLVSYHLFNNPNTRQIKLRYDAIGSHQAGISTHPQEQMAKLGFVVVNAEPVSIADCWLFTVYDTSIELPTYITLIDNGDKQTK